VCRRPGRRPAVQAPGAASAPKELREALMELASPTYLREEDTRIEDDDLDGDEGTTLERGVDLPAPPLPRATYWLRGSWRSVLGDAPFGDAWLAEWSAWAAAPTAATPAPPGTSAALPAQPPSTEEKPPAAGASASALAAAAAAAAVDATSPERLVQEARSLLRAWFQEYRHGLELLEETRTPSPDARQALHQTWTLCDGMLRALVQRLNALRAWQAALQLVYLSMDQVEAMRHQVEKIRYERAQRAASTCAGDQQVSIAAAADEAQTTCANVCQQQAVLHEQAPVAKNAATEALLATAELRMIEKLQEIARQFPDVTE